MKVATWNVNGIRARRPQLVEWVARDRPDVLCLQEIKASLDQIDDALFLLSDYVSYWHGAGGYSGVSVHLRKERFPEAPVFSHPPFDHECRIVEAKLPSLTVASVYVPNGGKDYAAKLAFLEQMAGYVEGLCASGTNVLLCGDLNVTRGDADVHPSQRKEGIIGQRPDERALFERLFQCGAVDVARALEPENERLFTWWPYWRNARARNLGWRIDYVLASADLAKGARSCEVLRDVGTSDHGPLVVEIDWPVASKSP